jgi:hypothetical protein
MPDTRMSPTIFRKKGYRFFFFSREESRMHIHVLHQDGEAKFWLKPQIELARNHQLSHYHVNRIKLLIEEHYDEFVAAWQKHFGN